MIIIDSGMTTVNPMMIVQPTRDQIHNYNCDQNKYWVNDSRVPMSRKISFRMKSKIPFAVFRASLTWPKRDWYEGGGAVDEKNSPLIISLLLPII